MCTEMVFINTFVKIYLFWTTPMLDLGIIADTRPQYHKVDQITPILVLKNLKVCAWQTRTTCQSQAY